MSYYLSASSPYATLSFHSSRYATCLVIQSTHICQGKICDAAFLNSRLLPIIFINPTSVQMMHFARADDG